MTRQAWKKARFDFMGLTTAGRARINRENKDMYKKWVSGWTMAKIAEHYDLSQPRISTRIRNYDMSLGAKSQLRDKMIRYNGSCITQFVMNRKDIL